MTPVSQGVTASNIRIDSESGSVQLASAHSEPGYAPSNRSIVRAQQVEQDSIQAISSNIRTNTVAGQQEYRTGAAASETAPNRFQETRLFTLAEAAAKARRALEAAQRRRSEYQRENARQESS